jgi:hypothetical protein
MCVRCINFAFVPTMFRVDLSNVTIVWYFFPIVSYYIRIVNIRWSTQVPLYKKYEFIWKIRQTICKDTRQDKHTIYQWVKAVNEWLVFNPKVRFSLLCYDENKLHSMTFSPSTPVSSTNKTDRHDITEILLKVALSTITHHK